MLNLELIDKLYANLSREQQQELIEQLFKKSKQTMNYFHRTKDISLSKLETMADFFHLPLDFFRVENATMVQGISTNIATLGELPINTHLTLENRALQKEVDCLRTALEAKDETIRAKQEVIDVLRSNITNPNVNRQK